MALSEETKAKLRKRMEYHCDKCGRVGIPALVAHLGLFKTVHLCADCVKKVLEKRR